MTNYLRILLTTTSRKKLCPTRFFCDYFLPIDDAVHDRLNAVNESREGCESVEGVSAVRWGPFFPAHQRLIEHANHPSEVKLADSAHLFDVIFCEHRLEIGIILFKLELMPLTCTAIKELVDAANQETNFLEQSLEVVVILNFMNESIGTLQCTCNF